MVSHFRLISLCNAAYKVVSKLLNKLVSSYHTGFIPGKNTQENIIIAKEVMHSLHHMKGKKGYFIVKVDLSKAYDKISWEFIWTVLCEIQRPATIINIIMHVVSSVETNVKWNGARNKYFRLKHGILQVDPISRYIFVLCMEKLSHLIMEAVSTKELDITWGRMGLGYRI